MLFRQLLCRVVRPKDMASNYYVVSFTNFRVLSGEHLEYYTLHRPKELFWQKITSGIYFKATRPFAPIYMLGCFIDFVCTYTLDLTGWYCVTYLVECMLFWFFLKYIYIRTSMHAVTCRYG